MFNHKFMTGLALIITLMIIESSGAGAENVTYTPRGIGGGGAMAGLSFSPYAHLWFVGTDMGTLFRSTDDGKSWQPISHRQVGFDSDLARSSPVGFSANPKVLFFAQGNVVKRSLDAGDHWQSIPLPLEKDEFVRYWTNDSVDPLFILCGTSRGLLKSIDSGLSWARIPGMEGKSTGTVILSGPSWQPAGQLIFHANDSRVFISRDHARSFEVYFTLPYNNEDNGTLGIRSFAAGSDGKAITLALIDTDGVHACSWAQTSKDSSQEQKTRTQAECGYVWVSQTSALENIPHFIRSEKEGGRFIRMAENDPNTIYLTGGDWVRQYGSKVWVSQDAGKHWDLRLQIYNWDTHPYSPWPSNKLEYSAVGLDVGWHDGVYPSFAINARNSAQAGGTGAYFLHVTSDFGKTWKAPFTQFADKGPRVAGKRWKSIGLEVTSVQKLKFHPKVSRIGYAGVADLGGMVTEDGGLTWRISKAKYNTNYDYAFDPSDENTVFAASGSLHDFPLGNNAIVDNTQGGIFRSNNLGKTWTLLTPRDDEWNIEFLSVAFDPIHRYLYGGTRGRGIGRSTDGGRHWEYINRGLPEGGQGSQSKMTIPQIEIDPETGNVYALLTGDAPKYSNQEATGIYLLDVYTDLTKHRSNEPETWRLLRGTVFRPDGVGPNTKLWWFPTSFAVDFSNPKREVLWLTDMESKGAWLSSGVWKTVNSGETWNRLKQFTHPTALTLDKLDPSRVFVSGTYAIDGSWGEGGAIYSTDGGMSWQKNEALPLLSNLDGTVLDPNNPGQLFYLYFGAGMLSGPIPK